MQSINNRPLPALPTVNTGEQQTGDNALSSSNNLANPNTRPLGETPHIYRQQNVMMRTQLHDQTQHLQSLRSNVTSLPGYTPNPLPFTMDNLRGANNMSTEGRAAAEDYLQWLEETQRQLQAQGATPALPMNADKPVHLGRDNSLGNKLKLNSRTMTYLELVRNLQDGDSPKETQKNLQTFIKNLRPFIKGLGPDDLNLAGEAVKDVLLKVTRMSKDDRADVMRSVEYVLYPDSPTIPQKKQRQHMIDNPHGVLPQNQRLGTLCNMMDTWVRDSTGKEEAMSALRILRTHVQKNGLLQHNEKIVALTVALKKAAELLQNKPTQPGQQHYQAENPQARDKDEDLVCELVDIVGETMCKYPDADWTRLHGPITAICQGMSPRWRRDLTISEDRTENEQLEKKLGNLWKCSEDCIVAASEADQELAITAAAAATVAIHQAHATVSEAIDQAIDAASLAVVMAANAQLDARQNTEENVAPPATTANNVQENVEIDEQNYWEGFTNTEIAGDDEIEQTSENVETTVRNLPNSMNAETATAILAWRVGVQAAAHNRNESASNVSDAMTSVSTSEEAGGLPRVRMGANAHTVRRWVAQLPSGREVSSRNPRNVANASMRTSGRRHEGNVTQTIQVATDNISSVQRGNRNRNQVGSPRTGGFFVRSEVSRINAQDASLTGSTLDDVTREQIPGRNQRNETLRWIQSTAVDTNQERRRPENPSNNGTTSVGGSNAAPRYTAAQVASMTPEERRAARLEILRNLNNQ